jgi:UDP-2,4-diacetamido-2,4,6-trideoxy-beta-L-altropyranose hydrolase
MRVGFRTDASLDIGSGHVMRCLALAHALKERGTESVFFSREHPGNLCDVVSRQGFPVIRFPCGSGGNGLEHPGSTSPPHADWLGAGWEDDALLVRQANTGSSHLDWMVVDHYSLDFRWEGDVRQVARKILVIDDLADRPHDCELLLDQNLYEDMETRYVGLTPESCRILLGPVHALLRPEFASARARLARRAGEVRRLLIYFGGVDQSNETTRAVRAFLDLEHPGVEAAVVVGGVNPHRHEVERLCRGHERLHFLCQVSDMAAQMAAADLSVGAGGASSWERCCVGLPAIVIAIAGNQVAIADALARRGACWFLGESRNIDVTDISEALERRMVDTAALRDASRRAMELTMGRGCDLLCDEMLA